MSRTSRQFSTVRTEGGLLSHCRFWSIVEYGLRDTVKPIGVAEWQLTRSLPADLEADLPSVDDLEAELADPNGEASEA